MNILFQHDNRCPGNIDITSALVYSAVNAVSIVTGDDWTKVVHRLIGVAHDRGYMPTDKTAISDMLRLSGFRPLTKIKNNGEIDQYLSYCESHPTAQYIAQLYHYGFFAIVPSSEVPSKFILRGCKKDQWEFVYNTSCYTHCSLVRSFWIFEGTDNRTGINRNAHRVNLQCEDHEFFHSLNLNPNEKRVGDCVVRALAGAYNCSWHEALELLAETSGYVDPIINSNENIAATLVRLGFIHHKTIRKNRRMLTGEDFCAQMAHTCKQGERIFAYAGKTHVIAIVPGESNQYYIQDSWDSSKKNICDYWTLSSPKKEESAFPQREGT